MTVKKFLCNFQQRKTFILFYNWSTHLGTFKNKISAKLVLDNFSPLTVKNVFHLFYIWTGNKMHTKFSINFPQIKIGCSPLFLDIQSDHSLLSVWAFDVNENSLFTCHCYLVWTFLLVWKITKQLLFRCQLWLIYLMHKFHWQHI